MELGYFHELLPRHLRDDDGVDRDHRGRAALERFQHPDLADVHACAAGCDLAVVHTNRHAPGEYERQIASALALSEDGRFRRVFPDRRG